MVYPCELTRQKFTDVQISIKKKIQNYKQKLRGLCELQKERDRVYRQGKGLLHHESPLSKNVTFDKITDKSTVLVS